MDFNPEVTTGPNSAWAEFGQLAEFGQFGPRDQCRLCARPKFGPIWYDVVEQFSFPSLVTDPGKRGVIGKLIHSSSCANFIQVQNVVTPNENPHYKTRGKVVPIQSSAQVFKRAGCHLKRAL